MAVPDTMGRTFLERPQCGQTPRDVAQKRVAGLAFNFSAVTPRVRRQPVSVAFLPHAFASQSVQAIGSLLAEAS